MRMKGMSAHHPRLARAMQSYFHSMAPLMMSATCDVRIEYFRASRVRADMKATLLRLVSAVVIVSSASSCTTAYDAYGNPQQVVDPGVAVAGAAAAGLLAYGLASSHHHHYRDDHYYSSRSYYRPSHYRSYPRYGYGYGGRCY